MPVVRTPISRSQLADLVGVDPERFLGIQMRCDREYTGWVVLTEGEPMQTTGTCPTLSDNTSIRKPTKKGKVKR